MRIRTLSKPTAVLVGLLVFTGGTATAATGGNLLLGRANGASTPTTLANSGGGAVLGLSARAGQAPLAVGAQAGKATNLNADKLDGLDSSAFVLKSQASVSTVSADGVFIDLDGDGALDPVLRATALCPAGTAASGGGFEAYTTAGAVISAPLTGGWVAYTLTEAGDAPDDLTAHVQCLVGGQRSAALATAAEPAAVTDRHRARLLAELAAR